ncbi:pentatricopeptide repeat-containing protein At2g41080 isoform X1 [Juglans microcarpa x Juglans regia]|uniref:pentatricopeptide repeat-containing protein At2g41080 isoform X1 n=2 Tax=Juglans microcarpa x Juglans regia TaxID=2249226 RepID=UPI001B7F2497|nr:pentatricopeptide repeat-containing protein At2g41080 isoform X1 [Juglans microcarpa x Juglans regia]
MGMLPTMHEVRYISKSSSFPHNICMAKFFPCHLGFTSLLNTLHDPSKRFFSTNAAKTAYKLSDSVSEFKQDYSNLCFKGHIKEAYERYKSEIFSEPSLLSNLIQACIPQKSLSLGKQLHSMIITSGCYSDKFVSNHLLNMYSKIGDLQTAVTLFEHMYKRNIMSCNILINGYVQSCDLESAQKVFDEMPDRNIATWNAMIAGLTQFEFNEQSLSFFSEMHQLGFLPDEFTLGSVLRSCAGLRCLHAGRQIHAYVVKCGFEFNLVVGSSLAHMYMKSGSLEGGEKVIKLMPIRNVIAWNTLIAGKAQNGYPEEVLDQYNMMKIAGFRPDKITFVSVLSSCSELATLGQGQQIHAEAIKAGACSVVAVVSSLISMYSRCGCLEDSLKAFLECEHTDVVLWSSMIAAYGFHGRGDEAIELFEYMEQEEIEANEVTFLSLLYACSHCGLKEKGIEFFDKMVKKYAVEPRLEHYTCMVDLLGRSGCLEEAEAMIRSMPVKADVIIWKTLLSACKIHKKADMAKRIAEEVIRLYPQDSAPYVLLSNIHASAKRWQDVSEVRKAMRDRMVKKEPGISWLEVKNAVHQFCIGDKTHPKSAEIDLYLKELTSEMKLRGYVPDTAAVLHDMDNEEKEYNLAHHSEKLAVAFALMNTPAGVPIRVMKNLRVCSDCHVAIKYISEIRNREIIVRDASRFHHFKNGKCSCGDYW